ncbi:MAG: hypothetical protein ACJAZO_002710 [Myxococcota bacterium]|jgi:hypothetical protein
MDAGNSLFHLVNGHVEVTHPRNVAGGDMAQDSAFQYEVLKKGSALPVVLELLGGFFFQTFGIGNLVAGNVGVGLALLFGYWLALFVNLMLTFVLIGFVTLPLTWLAFMIMSPMLANAAVERENRKLYSRLHS